MFCFPFLYFLKGSSGILELVLRSQDGDITYDFEPIPSVIASRGRPLIALKSPDLLNKRKEIILKVSITVKSFRRILKIYCTGYQSVHFFRH
jgi:hypothetical protein